MEMKSLQQFALSAHQLLSEYVQSHDCPYSDWQLFYQLITLQLLRQRGFTQSSNAFADKELCRQFPALFDVAVDCDLDVSHLLDQLPGPLSEETLGRLHQYYQIPQKDKGTSYTERENKVVNEALLSATQLFTPHWIIEYMVSNTLGKLFHNSNPDSDLPQGWNGYVENDPFVSSPDVFDVTIMDPAMGCGHLLLGCFDFLMRLAEQLHKDLPSAALHFLTHQVHGIDIDNRAVTIARSALLIKAACYIPNLLQQDIHCDLVCCFNEDSEQYPQLHMFQQAGSICPVDQIDLNKLDIAQKPVRLLQQQYDLVISNPPYLGSSRMSKEMKKLLQTFYPDSKLDLYAAFMEKGLAMTEQKGLLCMITQQSWMFLSGYQQLRKKILDQTLICMAHLGSRAFEDISGEVVQTTCFVLHKNHDPEYCGVIDRLVDPTSSQGKAELLASGKARIRTCQKNYTGIPGSPVAYWATPREIRAFQQPAMAEIAMAVGQNVTGDNRKYLRKHWELDRHEIEEGHRWIFYAKGGGYRKWWGNLENMIDWSEQAREEYKQRKGSTASQIIQQQYWYKKGITWGLIASQQPSFRVMPQNATFDKGGSTILVREEYYNTALACSNSKVTHHLSQMINPTLNFQVKDVLRMPVTPDCISELDPLVSHCLSLSRQDWDSFETSYEFTCHPMNDGAQSLYDSYRHWQQQCEKRFNELKETEEQINRILIDAYQLDIDPHIQLKEVTVHRIFDQRNQIPENMKISPYALTGKQAVKTYISAALRSLFTESPCYVIHDQSLTQHFIRQLSEQYPSGSLQQDLKWITHMIHNKEDEPTACLQYYFQTEFYKDHLSRFQKRPIYWLFDSGREHAFQVLVDMKQLTPDLFEKVRHDLLQQQISTLQQQVNDQPTARHSNQLREILQYRDRIMTLHPFEMDLNDGVAANMKKLQTDDQGQLQQIFALSEKVIK